MTLPWMTSVNTAPWFLQQPIYPRIVSISRLSTVAGLTDTIGNVGYSGAELGVGSEGEVVQLTALPASIQLKTGGRTTKNGELPGDAVTKPVWEIFIPASATVVQYAIRDRDIIIDDEGYRYEVGANYWTAFGYQLSTIRMEA